MKSQNKPIRTGASFFHSIRFRLVLWFTAILALVLSFFCTFIYFSQSRDLEDDALARLERRLARVQTSLRVSLYEQDGTLRFSEDFLEDSDAFALIGANGQVLASYGSFPVKDVTDMARQAARNGSEHEESFEELAGWVDREAGYAYAMAPIFGESGQGSLVLLGSPLDPGGRMRGLLTSLILGSVLTLSIATAGGFWLADRAMRPVRTITHTARTISETDLNRRINLGGKDEISELAGTFDTMLARLQAAFERQRQFVADASHELRTPLTIVNLETSRALAARRSPQEYERALHIIRSENEFMSHLVNDLLTLARMDDGQLRLEKMPLDLSDVAVDAIERLTPLAARNKVKLETGELPEVPILGDRQFLLQMVSNLIENGIKYTGGEDKRVYIHTGVSGGQAWIRVADNGPGIPPEHLAHLFDRFYRADQSRTRSGDEQAGSPGGSGLGLSIVQLIAQMHGGEVRVESTPGNGSRFEVWFAPPPSGSS